MRLSGDFESCTLHLSLDLIAVTARFSMGLLAQTSYTNPSCHTVSLLLDLGLARFLEHT
jgi:hypothetical protein